MAVDVLDRIARPGDTHQCLHRLRVSNGLRIKQVAESLGVGPKTVSQWENGQTSPDVWRAIAYAALVGHRFALAKHGVIVCDLRDVLSNPASFRRSHRLAQQQVADQMYVGQRSISALESRINRGAAVTLASLTPYLAAHGYQITLAPAQRLERAA